MRMLFRQAQESGQYERAVAMKTTDRDDGSHDCQRIVMEEVHLPNLCLRSVNQAPQSKA